MKFMVAGCKPSAPLTRSDTSLGGGENPPDWPKSSNSVWFRMFIECDLI